MDSLVITDVALSLTQEENVLNHRLHSITIVGLTLGVLGALYLAYELLDRRHGLLRRFLQLITPVLMMAIPWSVFAITCFFLAFIFHFFQRALLPLLFFFHLGVFFALVAAVFAMVGLLSGLYAEDNPPARTEDAQITTDNPALRNENSASLSHDTIGTVTLRGRFSPIRAQFYRIFEHIHRIVQLYHTIFSLRDSVKGFICSFIYWFIILIFIFDIGYMMLDIVIIICCAYASVACLACGF